MRLAVLLVLAAAGFASCAPVVTASRDNHRQQQLTVQLQSILQRHSSFWNASSSLALYNDTTEIAVAAGLNDYSNQSSKLTPNNQIPLGSVTRFFSAVSVLRLVEAGKLKLDEPIAPLVDQYLAYPEPCDQTPAMCETECVPFAHCFTSDYSEACAARTASQKNATCSNCFHHLHCFSASPDVLSAITLLQIWDNNHNISKVTFRHLLSMTSGVKDYYFDNTNWLYKQNMSSKRDVEPLEYLTHMDHSESPNVYSWVSQCLLCAHRSMSAHGLVLQLLSVLPCLPAAARCASLNICSVLIS